MRSESLTSLQELAEAVIVPPDGGWGWVIVFAAFFTNMVVEGVMFTAGNGFQEKWEEYFQVNSGTASFAISILAGTYQCVGPIVSVLANMYGCRKVAMAGAVLVALGFVLTAFARSISTVYLTFGLLSGLGFGLVYMPSILMVSQYFHKRRALATGIAVCGSGIGTFVMAPLSTILNSEYNWQNSLILIAGLALNCVIFGALYRDIQPSTEMVKKFEEKQRELEEERLANFIEDSKQNLNSYPSNGLLAVPQKITASANQVDDLEREFGSQTLSPVEEVVIEMPRFLARGISRGGDLVETAETEAQARNQSIIIDALAQMHDNQNTVVIEVPAMILEDVVEETAEMGRKQHARNITWSNQISNESKSSSDSKKRKRSIAIRIKPMYHRPHRKYRIHRNSRFFDDDVMRHEKYSQLSLNQPHRHKRSFEMAASRENIQRLNKPLSRTDIFYPGSTRNLREIKSQPNVAVEIASVTNLDQIVVGTTELGVPKFGFSFKKTLCSMLDVSLFKSPTFLNLFLVAFIYMIGFYTPFVYLPRYATLQGVSPAQASFLLSIIGIVNIIARLGAGAIADHPKVDPCILNNVSLLLMGAATMLVPLMDRYWMFALYTVVFGTGLAIVASLRPVITVELLGLDRLNNAFGLTLLACGVATFIGSPFAGWLRDLTGDLRWSFVVGGACLLLSGFISLPLRRINNWEFYDDDRSSDQSTSGATEST